MKITPPTPPGMSPAPDRGLFNPSERKRMRWLLITFVLVVVSLAVMLQRESQRLAEEAEAQRSQQAREPELETVVVVPEIDVARLEQLARDSTPGERALLEPAALTQAFRDARLLTDKLFEPMGGRALDADAAAQLVAAPSDHRGGLFRAHGWVDRFRRYAAAGDLPAHTRGLLRLEGGGQAWFAVIAEPERGLVEDDFVRLDGLFVEAYRAEDDGGGWIEAPLVAGPRAVTAFPRLDPVAELDPETFAEVTDDSIAEGISGQPFHPYWELVSYVRNLQPGQVDWSQAPVLDRETMSQLAMDGASFRAQPLRLPLSQVMDSWSQVQKDNPLRIERLTEGWIGNEKWFGPANGVIRYVSPFAFPAIDRKDEVLAQGFFLKHLAYEPSKGGVAIAPFFVLSSIEEHTPVVDKTWQRLLIGFTVAVLLLAGVIWTMLLRDRRRSAQLQEELLARRRARRKAQVGS